MKILNTNRLLKYTNLALVLILCLWCNVWAAVENFSTGWTETDPNNRLSQTATRSTWTGLTANEAAYVVKTAGVNYTGDWSIAFSFYVDNASGNGSALILPGPFLVDASNAGGCFVTFTDYDNSKVTISVGAIELSGYTTDVDINNTTLSVNTLYYALWRRDDDAGTNGTVYLDIYASSADRDAGSSVLLSLSVAITKFGKLDMTQAFMPYTAAFGDTTAQTAYLENLDLNYIQPATTRRRQSFGF
jgi:hypothetical protein